MPQLDLIIDTYLHVPAEVAARGVADPAFAARLWPLWRCAVSEDRGAEGVRWVLDDATQTGSCEVWIKRVSDDGCLARAFVRVDRAGRPWSRPAAAWRRRRAGRAARAALWRWKDQLECADPLFAR